MNLRKYFRLFGMLVFCIFAATAVSRPVDQIEHLIVIYQENWSFDGLYGKFPGANGIANAGDAARQVDRHDQPYAVLPTCTPCAYIPADLPSQPFDLEKYLAPHEKTRDLIHEFYRNQYQINGGRNNRFVAFSNAAQWPRSR